MEKERTKPISDSVLLAMELSCMYDEAIAASEAIKKPIDKLMWLGIASRIQKAHRMANKLNT